MSAVPSPIKNILLGITGGIAAYKAAELVRMMVKQGFDVQVVMTQSACQFITPTTMQALSGKPVLTELWHQDTGNGMAHINLARTADCHRHCSGQCQLYRPSWYMVPPMICSPRCAWRAANVHCWLAPAMNVEMWQNPATQRNIAQLRLDGIAVLGPDSGDQAWRRDGYGAYAGTGDAAAGHHRQPPAKDSGWQKDTDHRWRYL